MRIAICLIVIFSCTSPVLARKGRYYPCVPAVATQPAAPAVVRSKPLPDLPAGATVVQRALFHEQCGDRLLKASETDKAKRQLAAAEYGRAIALEPTSRRYWLRSSTTNLVDQCLSDRQWLLNLQPPDEYTLRVLDAQAAEAGEAKPQQCAAKLAEGIALAEELGHAGAEGKERGLAFWAPLRVKYRIHLHIKTANYGELIADGERLLKLQEEKDDRIRSLDFLARLLAACPDQQLRDPERAVKLAQEACELSKFKAALPIETLAAAQAASGDWSAAQDTLQLARGLTDQLVQMQNSLKLLFTWYPSMPGKAAANASELRLKQLQQYARHFESQVPLHLGTQPDQLRLLSLYYPLDQLDWYVPSEDDWLKGPTLIY